MNYLDFELEISSGRGREYSVAVVRSPAGEARETMHFPYDELALESRLDKLQIALLRSGGKLRRVLLPEQQVVQDFGRTLFDALLTRDVRSLYYESRREAARQDQGLRLKLRIQPPELAALPWEFLYDPREAEYVCLSRDTPLVRYLELARPVRPLAVTLPLRILGMVVSPTDLEPLDVALEKQRVEKATKSLRTDGLMELTWLDGQTWRHLQRAMRRGPWHVFHFIGHGGFDRVADEGYIALADEDGEIRRLTATRLGRLLANHRSLRLALLNSCEGARGGTQDIFSSTSSILVRRGIPAVLAMQYEITDRAAIELARTFYESLADGLPVDAALVEARTAISLAVNNTVEWGTPVLYMRSQDGILFSLTRKPATPPARPVAHKPATATVPPAQPQTPAVFPVSKPTSQPRAEAETTRLGEKPIPCVNGKTVLSELRSTSIPITVSNASQVVELACLGRGIISQLAVSPNGKTLAVSSSVGLWLYSMDTLEPKLFQEEDLSQVREVAWSPDGTRVASGGIVWDVASGKKLYVQGTGGGVAWSPDGTRLARGNKILDTAEWKGLQTLQAPDSAWSVAWSPDGKQLTTSDRRGRFDDQPRLLRLWDVTSGLQLRVLQGCHGSAMRVAWSPDGMQIAAADAGGRMVVWDSVTGQQAPALEGFYSRVSWISWSPDGKNLAAGSKQGEVYLWDIASGQQLHSLRGHKGMVLNVVWSSDGTQLVSGGRDGTLRVWDATKGEQLSVRTLEGHTAFDWGVWSPDGTQLASGSEADVVVRDAFSGKQLHRLSGHKRFQISGPYGGLSAGVTCVVWSPDGTRLASGGGDKTARIWDSEGKKQLLVLEGHTGTVSSLTWSLDGKLLVSGGGKTVRVWDTTSGLQWHILQGHTDSVVSVTWSPDGKLLASGDLRTVRVWDTVNWEELLVWQSRNVTSLSWSPDSRKLAVGSLESSGVQIWDAVGGQKLYALGKRGGKRVAWSPDGTLLVSSGEASGSQKDHIWIWDATNGEQLCALKGHVSRVKEIYWSPNGSQIISTGGDSTVRVWSIAANQEGR